MVIDDELHIYLEAAETVGALLICGPWGSGKTHIIKKFINDNRNKYSFGTVSLFGVESVEQFNKHVKDAYLSGLISVNKACDKGKKVVDCLSNIVADSPLSNKTVSTVAKGVSTIISFDYMSLFDVKNSIRVKTKNGIDEKPFVLIFDDFERCSLPIKDKLGLINDYLENKNIKTIIIADEERINDTEYIEFKEKVVFKTVRLIQPEENTVLSILKLYRTKNKEYKDFIIKHADSFVNAFIHSGYSNFRSLKCCISNFERLYELISTIQDFDEKHIIELIYWFSACTYETNYGVYRFQEQTQSFRIVSNNSISSEEIIGKYIEKTFNAHLYYLSNWLVFGEWNENQIKEEIIRNCSVKTLDPEIKLLNARVWDLEQSDIDNYLPIVIQKAYDGELSREELVPFLSTLHFLETYQVKLPCEISYFDIESGFDSRLLGVKNGDIIEPECHRYVSDSQINEAAVSLNNKIKSVNDRIDYWKNRNVFIDYFSGTSNVDSFYFKNIFFEEYDDEMSDSFVRYFFKSNNSNRNEALRIINNCNFSTVCNETLINNSIENMNKSINLLRKLKQKHKGSVDCALIDETINAFQRKIKIIMETGK